MRIVYIDENTDFETLFGSTEAKDSSTEHTEAKDSSTAPTAPTEAKDSSTEPTAPTNDGGGVHRLLYAVFGE